MARKKTIYDAVREVCLSFPEAVEFKAHGSPNFCVSKKTFAMFTVNHHGDGRVSLWLNSPPGAQEIHVKGEPRYFFVPPYVGPSGWLGVNLDKGLSWKRVAMLVREAYEKVAPNKLRGQIGKTLEISPPTVKMKPEEMDPMLAPRGQRLLKALRKACLSYPQTSEGEQFGRPAWRVGKRAFALAYFNERLKAGFWVGVGQQGLLTADERFTIPKYIGHNGWIELDVHDSCDARELQQLADASYRHFANKRMLSALDSPGVAPSRSKRKT
jgi:hypothetical protein